MSEKVCPHCAETIKEEAVRCKHCHADLSEAVQTPTLPETKPVGFLAKMIIVIVVLVVGFLGFGAIVGNSPEGQAKAHARRAIDLCRDNESSYRGPSGALAIISGACEKLETDFRTRFGHAP